MQSSEIARARIASYFQHRNTKLEAVKNPCTRIRTEIYKEMTRVRARTTRGKVPGMLQPSL